MEVFISWSGERSGAIASALRDWLPKILNSVKPWMSQTDIIKGTRWDPAISTHLEKAKAGIFCLTPANLNNKSVLFEAGAISKSVKDSRVYTLLADIDPANLEWPLAQFQATSLKEADIGRMLADINRDLASDGEAFLPDNVLAESYGVWWPKLEEKFRALPSGSPSTAPQRTDKAILEEILELVRAQTRLVPRQEELIAQLHRARSEEAISREKLIADISRLREHSISIESASSKQDELATTANRLRFLLTQARSAVHEALDKAGHQTAASILQEGKWSYLNGAVHVKVSVKKTMLALTMNTEANKVVGEALRSIGIKSTLTAVPQHPTAENESPEFKP
jgi:TIR domain